MQSNDPRNQERQYRFEGGQIDEAMDRIAKANARLERAGIEDRFEVVNVRSGQEEQKKGDFPFQVSYLVDYMEFDLNAPVIGYDGWRFVASVSFEEGGTLVNAVPGEDLSDWDRPEDHLCEHCGYQRDRVKSYVLRSERTGQYRQVGSSCISLFLGVNPALWAVGWELPEPSEEGGGFSNATRSYNARNWLALSLAASDHGAGFVSKGKALENQVESTYEIAMDVIYPEVIPQKDWARKERAAQNAEEAQRILDEEPEMIEAVIEAGKRVNPDSDYGANLHVVLNSENVSEKGLGILTSAVSVWYREQEREAERKANPVAEGFIGEVKDRLKNLKVVVTGIHSWEGFYGITTLVSWRTESGHVVKWFASGDKDFELGQEMIIDGTVKACENYKGQDQTVLTRCRVK